MIVAAGFEDHRTWAAFGLMLASAGTFLHTGLKVPYFIWFGKNNCSPETWERAADPPWNMSAAMAVTSLLCIGIGCYTPYLYNMLPYPVDYHPYTAYHVSETLQILLFTAVGFLPVPQEADAIAHDQPGHGLVLPDGRSFRRDGSPASLLRLLTTWVGELYRTCALAGLMVSARVSAWFDWHVIDGVVDGLARRRPPSGRPGAASADGTKCRSTCSVPWP